MTTFIELARRALNPNTAAAATGIFAIILGEHFRGDNVCNDCRRQTRCDAFHREFERHDLTLDAKADLESKSSHISNARSSRAKHADELHSTYMVDWKTVLGEGAYGRVYPGRHRLTGEKVALKKISKRYTNSSSFRSETDALLRIYDNGGHPNISGLRDMYFDGEFYYLLLDLVPGGEMFTHLINYGSYSEDDASRLVQEILSALAYLHNLGITHADLKPENVLLCEKTQGSETVKLIDFGCAKIDKERGNAYFQNNTQDRNITLRRSDGATSIGTKAYWAPECFSKDKNTTESIDLWALGVLVYIMLVGVHPFDTEGHASDEEIEERIKTNPLPPMTHQLTSHLSPSAKDFIKSLMNPDPDERLTAIAALRHSWIRGERTPTEKIVGSDCKLEMYQDLRHKLATGIFAALVDGVDENSNSDSSDAPSRTHILKRAFEVFDEQKKGYVNEADLTRVITKVTDTSFSGIHAQHMISAAKKQTRSKGLSLSDFSQLFSRLGHEHYPKGSMIYEAGDVGNKMYFINAGKVEIRTKQGHLVSILRHGDFFGEGSLLEERNNRFTSARCATPVDVIIVSREDFTSYIASSLGTKQSLKQKYKERTLMQAKQLIRLQTTLTKRSLVAGDIVYREGDLGDSMFLVDDNDGGKLTVERGGKTVHTLQKGDTFGESSLLFRQPRKCTVICAAEQCHLHELHSNTFHEMVEADPTLLRIFGTAFTL